MKNERPPKLIIVQQQTSEEDGLAHENFWTKSSHYYIYLILASIIGDDSRVHVLFGTLTLFLMHERLAKGQLTPTQELLK